MWKFKNQGRAINSTAKWDWIPPWKSEWRRKIYFERCNHFSKFTFVKHGRYHGCHRAHKKSAKCGNYIRGPSGLLWTRTDSAHQRDALIIAKFLSVKKNQIWGRKKFAGFVNPLNGKNAQMEERLTKAEKVLLDCAFEKSLRTQTNNSQPQALIKTVRNYYQLN